MLSITSMNGIDGGEGTRRGAFRPRSRTMALSVDRLAEVDERLSRLVEMRFFLKPPKRSS